MSTPNATHSDVIKNNDLLPGDCVSTDQCTCIVKGRLPNTRGCEDTEKMYYGGTILVDRAASKMDIYHQVSLGGSDTVCDKELCKQRASEFGMYIQTYRGDNGVFKSQIFKEDIQKRNQLLTFSGVGTHGQNGVAE